MKLVSGISTYAYTWAIGVPNKEPKNPMGVFDFIDKAIKLGVRLVQIADNLPLENFSDVALGNLKSYADEKGIAIEVGTKKLTKERLTRFIAIAAFLESRILRFVIDGTGYTPTIDDVIKIIQESLPELEKNQVYLALENHDRLLTSQFVEIVERVNSEYVGICLDTVNSMGAAEGLETVMERLGPYTLNFHVKEFTVRRIYHMMGFEIEGLPLGNGMLPIKKILKHLGPRCKTVILEQWTPPIEGDLTATIQREDQWAQKSMGFLNQVLAEEFIYE